MTQTSLRDQAYTHIRHQMLGGQLKAGTRLSEISVANEIGISKTPVREAFRQLESEGLLEQIPRVGTVVREPTRREIIELYEYREALETHAVRLGIDRITLKELALMERMCQGQRKIGLEYRERNLSRMTKEMIHQTLSMDMAFHVALLGASRNRRIIQAVDQSRVLTRIFCFSRYHDYDMGFISGTYLYHMRILRAMKKRDVEQACYWMRCHLQISRDHAVADFEQRQAEGEQTERYPLSLPPDVRRELEELNED